MAWATLIFLKCLEFIPCLEQSIPKGWREECRNLHSHLWFLLRNSLVPKQYPFASRELLRTALRWSYFPGQEHQHEVVSESGTTGIQAIYCRWLCVTHHSRYYSSCYSNGFGIASYSLVFLTPSRIICPSPCLFVLIAETPFKNLKTACLLF